MRCDRVNGEYQCAFLDCFSFDLILVIVVVTPHGDECSGEDTMKCTRRWNDFEVDGPRCNSTAVSVEISLFVSQFAELYVRRIRRREKLFLALKGYETFTYCIILAQYFALIKTEPSILH